MSALPERAAAAGSEWSACVVAIASCSDREAFARLFRHFAPRVKSYLLRFHMEAAVAEELAQETLLTVWRKAAYFDPARASASTWIFTIARNLRVDFLRGSAHPEALEDHPALESADPLPGDVLLMSEREERTRDALTGLPQDQAEVVRLSFFEDKPHSEIARELGIPLGTVKSRLRLAFGRLKTALEVLT
jgi:RNA polymerase sigma-70 factor (ECF subfamily)